MTRDQCRALDRAYSALDDARRHAKLLDGLIELAEACGGVDMLPMTPSGARYGTTLVKIPHAALVAVRKELLETAENAVRDCGGEP